MPKRPRDIVGKYCR